MMGAVTEATQEIFGDIPVIPAMLSGATDSPVESADTQLWRDVRRRPNREWHSVRDPLAIARDQRALDCAPSLVVIRRERALASGRWGAGAADRRRWCPGAQSRRQWADDEEGTERSDALQELRPQDGGTPGRERRGGTPRRYTSWPTSAGSHARRTCRSVRITTRAASTR